MTNLTIHPKQTTTHTRQSRIPFLQKKNPCKTAYLETITNLPHPGGYNCLKKKKKKREREREREKGAQAKKKKMRPQPLRGQSRNNHHRKREGEREKIRQLGTEE